MKIPFVTVHHLEAHCLMARLQGEEITRDTLDKKITIDHSTASSSLNNIADSSQPFQPKVSFPFLALLVSGGHTSILLCRGLGEYTVLGATLDDSLGEAFDKASRLLGLRTAGYPLLCLEYILIMKQC